MPRQSPSGKDRSSGNAPTPDSWRAKAAGQSYLHRPGEQFSIGKSEKFSVGIDGVRSLKVRPNGVDVVAWVERSVAVDARDGGE